MEGGDPPRCDPRIYGALTVEASTQVTVSDCSMRTPVEGIRLHGELAPFVMVRGSSLSGFRVGVRIVPVGAVPPDRMWLVAETVATGATAALDAPATVGRERTIP